MYSNTLIKTIFWGEGEGKREVEGGGGKGERGSQITVRL